MTHPLFHKEIFLETAFEKRFQAQAKRWAFAIWSKRLDQERSWQL